MISGQTLPQVKIVPPTKSSASPPIALPPGWFKPTPQDMADAPRRRLRDLIAPDLKVLFVGINPGIYTAAIRRHFGRPGNRFWPALFAGGFTPRVFSPFENMELLALGYGITNIVSRPTLRADELTREELVRGARALKAKVRKYRPRFVAFLGVTSYRVAFDTQSAAVGEQRDHRFAGARVWVLPNPSGLNAHFTPGKLAHVFAELRSAVDASQAGNAPAPDET
jgi:TDG/mug DNA glycosylase family protein